MENCTLCKTDRSESKSFKINDLQGFKNNILALIIINTIYYSHCVKEHYVFLYILHVELLRFYYVFITKVVIHPT